MRYNMDLYQVKINYDGIEDTTDILFKAYDTIEDKSAINIKRYDKVDALEVEAENIIDAMEMMFVKFNQCDGYNHRSMTTSDVIGIYYNDKVVYFYCDFIGYVELEDFCNERIIKF